MCSTGSWVGGRSERARCSRATDRSLRASSPGGAVPLEPREDLLVEDAVRRDGTSAVDRPGSVQVAEPTARFLHDDGRRGEIPRVEVRLDHRLGGTLRHQRVAPEVAETTVTPGSADEGTEARRLLAAGDDVAVGGVEELRLRDGCDRRDVDATRPVLTEERRALRPRAEPLRRVPALAKGRRGDDANDDLVTALRSEQDAEQGDTADEVRRSVDRIDPPADVGAPLLHPVFLAVHTVRREAIA